MTEKEFKFDVDADFDTEYFIKKLEENGKFTCRFKSETEYTDTYLDARNGRLYLAGFGLRLRVYDGKRRLELKSQPKKAESGFFDRHEWCLWEDKFTGPSPAGLPETFIGEKVSSFF